MGKFVGVVGISCAILGAWSTPALCDGAAPPKGDLPSSVTTGVDLPAGSWVRYRITNKKRGMRAVVRFAGLKWVGKKTRWFEVSLNRAKLGQTVFRTLIRLHSKGKTEVLRTIMQMAGRAPVELPSTGSRGPTSLLPSIKRNGASSTIRRVRVPGGVFRARYWKTRGKHGTQQSWVRLEKTPWPLLRFESAKVVVEFMGSGKAARSEIVGEPRRMTP